MEKHGDHVSQVIDRGFRGSVFAVLDAGEVHLAIRKRMYCAQCRTALECRGEDIRDAFRGSLLNFISSLVVGGVLGSGGCVGVGGCGLLEAWGIEIDGLG